MDVDQALELLKDQGYKYTGKREEMIRVFAKEKRYMSAKEILDYMKPDYPNISFDTIYRNLSLFTELHILEETEFNNERKYRFSCAHKDHHHHLICLRCGKTKHLKLCPLDGLLGDPDDFTITDHKFEIYGYCQQCE
ncbi:Fur family transcriptional regulator [Ammoniphilus resinae]|uniref:Fur family zinc uptake transcriptional regulator n=1 Tax=Ammoniphilus resinae TaxID=861532 RepID=A0ABS4GSB2_9BACL|nr:Fur family transcriptional regulator [Ammoniphilus resinae]MBP1933134.1 Fur family zinc uptake transcriptional regulator [Ammoniphilus resinae]